MTIVLSGHDCYAMKKKEDLAVYIIRERGKICWKANIIKSMRTVDIGNNAR